MDKRDQYDASRNVLTLRKLDGRSLVNILVFHYDALQRCRVEYIESTFLRNVMYTQ